MNARINKLEKQVSLIEDELRKAVKDGKIDTGSKVEVDAEITIKNLNVSHKLNGTLTAPD